MLLSLTGTTAVTMALVPGVEKVVTLDIEPYLKEFNTPFWQKAGVADKIDCRIGDGLSTLKNLGDKGEKFDFVFVSFFPRVFWLCCLMLV